MWYARDRTESSMCMANALHAILSLWLPLNFILVLFLGHSLQCSGFTPGSVLRNYYWQDWSTIWDARAWIIVDPMQGKHPIFYTLSQAPVSFYLILFYIPFWVTSGGAQVTPGSMLRNIPWQAWGIMWDAREQTQVSLMQGSTLLSVLLPSTFLLLFYLISHFHYYSPGHMLHIFLAFIFLMYKINYTSPPAKDPYMMSLDSSGFPERSLIPNKSPLDSSFQLFSPRVFFNHSILPILNLICLSMPRI